MGDKADAECHEIERGAVIDEYDRARIERDEKRHALRTTAAETRTRLQPSALMSESLAKVKSKARSEPRVTASIFAVIAAMLFRKPIFNALRRAMKEKRK